MDYTSPGHHKSFASFRAHLRSLAPECDADEALLGAAGPLGRAISVHGKSLENRFAIHPMEGWDGTRDGLPTELTLRRWRRFGESGAALIWGGEAFAVRRDGRANPLQLYLEPGVDTKAGLAALHAELVAGVRARGGDPARVSIGLQLTHSGRWSRPDGPFAPKIATHAPALDAKAKLDAHAPLLGDGELEAIGEDFVRSAVLAREVGFDFVDVKACHGYLLHELLAAHERPGIYGGSFENRTRLHARILRAIRVAAPGLAIGMRLSLGDVHPYWPADGTRLGEPRGYEQRLPYRHGFGVSADDPRELDLEEPLRFLARLRDLDVRLVNLTLGSPYTCPHLQRPAGYPPSDGYLPPEDPLRSVTRHLLAVRAAKRAVPELQLVGTGYSYLQEWLPHVAQHEVGSGHVDFIGLGRMVLVYPELPRDVLAGTKLERKKICRTFSECTTAPRNGMVSGCYPLDPFYRARPEAPRVRALQRGEANA
ncbi:MAG: NADH:flavin oxidoreductase [Planctomycetes bacterium]|nr:NADH:flavin oxidoreductase [Planctomycetota bacterium]